MQQSKKAISHHLQHRSVPGFLTGQKNNSLFQYEGIELSYCSDDLAVFSDSVGSVIYDRTKKKVIAAIDLDKIGCDHFYSEGDEEDPGLETAIKVSKDQKWMIIYNQLQGKVKGNNLCIFAQTV